MLRTQTFEAMLRQLESILGDRSDIKLFGLSDSISKWIVEAEADDIKDCLRFPSLMQTLLLAKATLDRRRWIASWRVTAPMPMFAAEWYARIIDMRLCSSGESGDAGICQKQVVLSSLDDDALEAHIRSAIDELGAAQPLRLGRGSELKFYPLP